MKEWLRLTLVTATIGGGFTGIAVVLQGLFTTQGQAPTYYALMLGFLALFAFVTASGVIFVHEPARTQPVIVALALQVPWFSSPIFAYKFSAGFQLSGAVMSGGFAGKYSLGSEVQINIFQQLPWGVGINFFALALLLLLVRAVRAPSAFRSQPPPPMPVLIERKS